MAEQDCNSLDAIRARLNNMASEHRVKVFCVFCLATIAIVAMFKLADPENIVINVVVAICSFTGGAAVGASMRRSTESSVTKEGDVTTKESQQQ
jgi:hypothetical protein